MRKKKEKRFVGFTLVPDTAGKIVDSVWIKDDNTEIKIVFAWGKTLSFRPIEND